MNADCHPIEQQARQDALDAAYLADGRDNPSHPHHATYTALMSEQASPQPTLEDLLGQWWRDSYPTTHLHPQTGAMMCAFAAFVLEQQQEAAA